MDLNNIELPASLIVDLYHTSLFNTNEFSVEKNLDKETPKHIDKVETTAPFKWLGDNKKNILVIVNNKEVVYLPDNELTFFTGILSACKLTVADVAILNFNIHPEVSYKELTAFFKSKIVFLFDVEPAAFGLPMNFPHYQIQAFAGNSFLYSPSFKDLENDKVQKSKLWICLKRLFNL